MNILYHLCPLTPGVPSSLPTVWCDAFVPVCEAGLTNSNHPDFVSGSLSVLVSYTLFDKYTLTCVHKYRIGPLHSKSFVFCIFCLSWDPTSDTLWTPYHVCICLSQNAVQLEFCGMKLLQLGFICLGVFICVSSKLSCSIAHFFLTLNSILLSVCTTVYLSIPLLKDAS